MEFGNLQNFICLIFPLILLLIMILGMRKRKDILNILKLRNKRRISIIKILLLTLGSVLVVISLLSPQKEIEDEEIEVKGMNIYVLIDTSRSMLTEDVYPNRLEAGKRVLTNLIQSLKGDRVGFIPFSDSAYIQMPLTDDYNITQNYINAIDTTLISGGGTELYQALELAEKSFKEIGSENKTVIVISDGGDFDKKSLDFVKENKIDVYSIGVGTKEGNVIPEYLNGVKRGFIKDESGSAVISKLNSDFLQKISNENNGKYYEVNNLVDTSKNFVNDTINLERKNQRNEKTKNYEKYFQYPLALGILFILIGYLLKEVIKDEE
ncbi:MAG: VWA domain-containing protein [Fusobacterium mortiferum]|jgi:Ca-activated chloride channel family protein|uniref:VWA domain-containing protein n=2 Tax=Fusobacterium TaxID=848 RepID=A0A414PUX6_FUSMR|nr:VWA domain-containing protein [Fusobacterium mortiferum]MSS60921.1 VWA domain-containing protein [Fusobacterium sp. FSA-380-WT-2B]MDD7262799.1 VWA domain-containing protein [Fusobacterium mortiferum]MDY4801143.1 VWA domain-containing protein [Fusobacterium mortiferum]MDY5981350.1 VWA domain-containing protein [Fusobacterium mortiferum]RHF64862.1 VWA domain-containing protein [Fusobacterium mortiferum]